MRRIPSRDSNSYQSGVVNISMHFNCVRSIGASAIFSITTKNRPSLFKSSGIGRLFKKKNYFPKFGLPGIGIWENIEKGGKKVQKLKECFSKHWLNFYKEKKNLVQENHRQLQVRLWELERCRWSAMRTNYWQWNHDNA